MTTMNFCNMTTLRGTCEGEHPEGGECLEPLRHPWKKCPVCNTPITWTNYPKAARKKLVFTPKEQLGRDLLAFISKSARYTVVHFADIHTLRRWEAIIAIMPEAQIRAEWPKCAKKAKGRGLLQYILNRLDWIIDHDQVERLDEQYDPDAPYDPDEDYDPDVEYVE